MIHNIFIKPVTVLSCHVREPRHLLFLLSFIHVFPLIVTSLCIQAASKHSQVSPEGILFSSVLHSVTENAALPAARLLVQGFAAAWKVDTVSLPAAQRTAAALQDVSFQLLEQVRAGASVWRRGWIDVRTAASLTPSEVEGWGLLSDVVDPLRQVLNKLTKHTPLLFLKLQYT